MSGLKWHQGDTLKFLTLTSKVEGGLGQAWHTLYERIKRMTPARLVREGYLDASKLHYYYPNKAISEPLKMEYLKVETREGNGVLHAVFFGDYLPYAWLSHVWSLVHDGSWNVHVSSTRGGIRSPRRVSSYILRQYIQNQNAHVRTSWNQKWVFRGFVQKWKSLLKDRPFEDALNAWDVMMERHMERPVDDWDRLEELVRSYYG